MALASLNTAFDIADLFKQVYGYKPAHVPGFPQDPAAPEIGVVQPVLKKTETLYGQQLYDIDALLGVEVFCPIVIEVDGVDYPLPHTVIGIDRDKTVISTPMTELDGDANEIIGNRDIIISVKGFLIGAYEQFPDDQIKTLNDVFSFNKPARLKSAYTDLFLHDNDNVIILKMSLPQKTGVVGVKDFALQLKTDRVFTLYQS